jgi:MFS family permease
MLNQMRFSNTIRQVHDRKLGALLAALRFDQPQPEALLKLTAAEWRKLLDITDREHLTLALGLRWQSILPEWVRARVDRNLKGNAERLENIRKVFEDLSGALKTAGIDFAVLKGFSHWPGYVLDPLHRPQYDLDLLCPPDQVHGARKVLASIGYEPISGFETLPIDHLTAMIRKTGWQWRGDYFDTDAPLSVELHFRLWDADTERIGVAGLEPMWDRRVERRMEGLRFAGLDPVDTVAYASLHLLRHLLRGDVRLYHAYELAHFLETTSQDSSFWARWRATHPDSLRAVQAISFRLAAEWFGSRAAGEVRDELARLAEPVQRWFRLFAMAPVEAKVRPNKNELWLHLSLAQSAADKRAVAVRRILPFRRVQAQYAAHVPESEVNWRLRLMRRSFQFRFIWTRVAHHVRSTAPTLAGGLRWWWSGKDIDPQFLVFLSAASLFNFGMSIYFLLYNLFLLQRGFHEDFLGAVASTLSVGSIAGTIPAAFILHRFGLRRTLISTFAGVPMLCLVRALDVAPPVLIGSAFAGGFLFSFYAVALAPTVAQLTTERSRPFGFSLVLSIGIGIGVLAGLVGGRLPALLAPASAGDAVPIQPALVFACVVSALGALPTLYLRFVRAPASEQRVYPRNGFIRRYLLALLVWNLATGAFNPFVTAYFAQALHMPVAEIGLVSSVAQFVQVIAVLGAPLILRHFGAITGIMYMQMGTAAALGLLALGAPGVLAGSIYAGYMAFQYMSEPGMFSLLMDGVDEPERSGASALNVLVIFGGQALAAAVAGFGVRRFGYPVVLAAAALIALIASFIFRALLGLPATRHPSRASDRPRTSN